MIRKVLFAAACGVSLFAVAAIAVTPSGPPIVYAGGSALSPGDPQLFRSTNGAVTWQPVATFPAPLSPYGGTSGNQVNTLAIDPTNPSRIYAGFQFPDYVMRSDDAGATWTRATVGLGAGPIVRLLVDPASPSTLYAAQFGSGVFRSTDRGATWTALDDGLRDDALIGLALDPFVAGRIHAATGSGQYAADLESGVPAGDRRAIEYYYAAFNHYFVSADLDEIAGLDAGAFQGWSRTGEGFRVAEAATPGNSPVCRFFSIGFQPLATHFYTPYANECEILKADPNWVYEKIAFGLATPDPTTRGCPSETRVLYRLWNRNQGGVPNHRYTTSAITFDAMIDQGWIFEGNVETRVFACVPY